MIGGFIGNPIGGRLAVEADNLQTVTATATVSAATVTNIIFAEMINAGVALAAAFGAMSVGKIVSTGVDLSVSAAKATALSIAMAVDVTVGTVRNISKLLVGIGVDLTVSISHALGVLVVASITAGVSFTRNIGKRINIGLDLLVIVLRKLRPDRIKAAISAGFARSTISRH